ncbi:VUT family protein [Stappia sp. GBMRC 2046]|uniref:Probable queuosine precursor transporter n=1 Tax=Stappia sediminis TaxID=2692190 RepID=A0A7X3LTY1_9HYPH|nr:VUT family protein [Stappia sediminis]MXN65036.1 VUT family protein [Stappia sediminis]
MTEFRRFSPLSALVAMSVMVAVVVAANILVQYPVMGMLGPINLADILTWGAFTYPAAFLVNDLTNRRFGPAAARKVVIAGFVMAVILSIWLATPRIAIASGSAFLFAQLLDIAIFDRLRLQSWWKAPVISSLVGSFLDTVLFFSLAFAGVFASVFGFDEPFATEAAPLLGAFAIEVPRWVSWALGDYVVKIFVATALLAPYRVLLAVFGLKANPAAA